MQHTTRDRERSTPTAVRAAFAVVVVLASALALKESRDWRSAAPPVAEAPHLSPDAIAEAESRVIGGLGESYPGAAVAVGIGPSIEHVSAHGRLAWSSRAAPVSADSTLYDLASLTKAVATTTAVLILADDGVISLDDPVRKTLPEFEGRWKDRVTWRHLLTHTSGLPAGTEINGDTPAERARRLLRTRLVLEPGEAVNYSDIGYVVLWEAAERAAGEPLERFLRRRVWEPLGMRDTRFSPGAECRACAPTLVLRSGELFRGRPSDETARLLGGVTGNAGLFSTVRDIARFTAMIANEGELDGVRILKRETVAELMRQQPGAGRRTLGWTSFCPDEPSGQHRRCERPVAFGHTGWSGTSIWIDPVTHVWTVVLANRTLGRSTAPPPLDDIRAEVFRSVSPYEGRVAD